MISSSALRSLLLSAAVLLVSLLSPLLCPAAQPVEGILLLRNGNILRGKVQLQGEHYHVHLPHGQLQVRASQVETCCKNIEAAFQYRRKIRGGSSADSHLDLAGWCLRHDLFEHAENELEEAQTTDPDHPRLVQLQRQLKQSRQLALRENQQRTKANVPMMPVEPPDPATLEKAPQWARALFVRQIQPLVVHACATSGCHQLDSAEDYHLNRLALDGGGHPEATLRNLAATLEQIDWQTATESALLKRARQAHGSVDASTPLPAHKLQVLQGWIEQLAEAHRKENEIGLLPPVVEIAALPPGERLILNPPRQATVESPSSDRSNQVRQVNFAAVDPFDPSAFNRRSTTQEPAETTVPHVLAPTDPSLTPAAAIE